jgi:hypothetical protein
MSEHEHTEQRGLPWRLPIALLIVGAAAYLGWWFGKKSVPEYTPIAKKKAEQARVKREKDDFRPDPKTPPVFFAAGATTDAAWDEVFDEIKMAADAGVHQYMLTTPLPWAGPKYVEDTINLIDRVVDADPKAAFLLRVNLNPPDEWLAGHPGEAMVVRGETRPYPSPASKAWIEVSSNVLAGFVSRMDVGVHAARILGYVLTALGEDRWCNPGGFDESPVSLKAFRAWLRIKYKQDDTLRAAWGNNTVTLDTASIPQQPPTDDLKQVFYALPAEQPIVDYLRCFSETTADAIAAFTSFVAQMTENKARVIVPYGYTYELTRNDAGYFALGNLLDSDIAGFISPVSYVDRGLGGAGGMMGPVDSAKLHGKQWYIIDDTRTGMERDAATGAFARMKGLRAEDVFSVQRRNFAAALVHGLGVMWADPQGEGWLHDPDQWQAIGAMAGAYAKGFSPKPEGEKTPEKPTAPPPEEPPAASSAEPESPQVVAPEGETMPERQKSTCITVVVDEAARSYQRCDAKLNEWLLQASRDAAIRAGVATRFCLLQDITDDRAEPSEVYLFLNAFHLTADERARVRVRLSREAATALWLYAPGYIDAKASVENISATVGMHVAAFQGPTSTESTFALEGHWLKQDQPFGVALEMAPLFYVEDSEADVLAKFRAGGKASVATRYVDDSWTSVYIATPSLSPDLLCEILTILEQPFYVSSPQQTQFDTVHANDTLLAVHARHGGDRTVHLPQTCNLEDLLDPNIGFPEKQDFVLPLRAGETRLFKLSPL